MGNLLQMSPERQKEFNESLTQEDALRLRQMNFGWQYKVDTFYDFHFENDLPLQYETRSRLPTIRIRSYTINRLSPKKLYPKPPRPRRLFAFPRDLKVLRVDTTKIRKTDYKWLLQEVGPHLREFYLQIGNQNGYLTGHLQFTFSRLCKLEIIDRRVDFLVGDIFNLKASNDVYLNTVGKVSVNCPLNSITVQIERGGIEEHRSVIKYTHALFVLISQHGQTLKNLSYSYSNDRMREITGFQREIAAYSFNQADFNNVTNLEEMEIKYSSSTNAVQPMEQWVNLIGRQIQLRLLTFEY